MSDTKPAEPVSKFTPEQCQYLGRVYATILNWNREDEVRQQEAGPVEAPSASQDTATNGQA